MSPPPKHLRRSPPGGRPQQTGEAGSAASSGETGRCDSFAHVVNWLAQRGHPHAPRWLDVPARTCDEAARALGLQTGQIAKSVVFRRRADGQAVLVVASGDRRVDEHKVAAQVGPIGRADAAFVKQQTGFSIGGVAPVGHAQPPLLLIDRDLFRFDAVWAAAGHPNGVFCLSPDQLVALTGAPVADVVVAAAPLACADHGAGT